MQVGAGSAWRCNAVGPAYSSILEYPLEYGSAVSDWVCLVPKSFQNLEERSEVHPVTPPARFHSCWVLQHCLACLLLILSGSGSLEKDH